jgi:hypothetical protein
MSTLKKDHILSTGAAATVAGATGAAIGAAVAGPAGLAVGAVAAGALGAVLGERAAEARDKRGDLGHFEQIYRDMPYYIDGMGWDDYAPAYRLGLETWRTQGGQDFSAAEPVLEADWSRARDASRLTWLQARSAVQHAWRELAQTLQARGT